MSASIRHAANWAILLAALILPRGPGLTQPSIPEALEPWRDWVLSGQEFRACPVLNGRDADQEGSHVCAWPGTLAIDVDGNGARFEQRWTLYKEDWVPLPGGNRDWPRLVTVDGEPQAAVQRAARPAVRVPAGEHTIAGELAWASRPASLPVPTQTGIVALTLDGAAVERAELDAGVLWLGLRPDLVVEDDRLTVQVYRRLTDAIPLRLDTQIELDVAGQSRELELSGALLPGFVGESLSSTLPVELDPDGTLRLQIRPGSWTVTLVAHNTAMATAFARAPRVDPWPEQEIWSFASSPELRVAVLEGAPAIDSRRAGVPGDWASLPSYVVAPDTSLDLIERSRNDARDANRLRLARQLWLDFDGEGFTTRDLVSGTIRNGWRLDMAPPYTMTMASIDDENLLVTEGPEPGSQGVEFRDPTLELTSIARLPARMRLPVTGYTDTFDQAAVTVNLPPAHRLVAAPGADGAGLVWTERWRLLDIFLALITAIAAWRLLGPRAGTLALATLVLIFHEPWAPHYAWLNLLLITALVGVVPEGRIRGWCRRYRYLSIAWLAVLLVPFATVQLRDVVFPQLEQAGLVRGSRVGFAAPEFAADDAARAQRLTSAIEPAVVATEELRARQRAESVVVTGTRIGREPSRYVPGALVQTGPGLPDWTWNRYVLDFDGPIDRNETVTLVIFGPWLVGLWRVLGVAGALALAWLLVRGSPKDRSATRSPRGTASAAAAALLLVGAAPPPADAQTASSFPSPQLLDELRDRLTEPAPCHPACAELTDAVVAADQTALRLDLEMAVQDDVAVPMPGQLDAWAPQSITVDGRAVTTLLRTPDGIGWIALDAGVRRVRLEGAIPAGNALTVPFPLAPRRIAVTADGWDVAGVGDGRLPSGALELIRQRPADAEDVGDIQATAFPTFVRVTRYLEFDIDWRLTTEVVRVAPADSAFTVAIDLLPDETVTTEEIEIGNGQAQVAFEAGQDSVVWQSTLPVTETLTLTAPTDAPWVETWRSTVHPIWHVEYDGLPATPPERFPPRFYSPDFLPRPGETLTLRFSSPEPVSGDTIAIDDALYTRNVGERASSSVLDFSYRSTRAVEHPIVLPAGTELEAVSIDGQTVPLQLDGNSLSLPVTPGRHRISIRWRDLDGIGLNAAVGRVDLGAGASNLTTRLNLPRDRWTLVTYGPTLGPAVLYWAELAVFALVAVLLGKLTLSPLRTHEWLLLGLGLSTFSWPVLLLFAAWAFVMSWRGQRTIGGSRFVFNGAQIALALLTLATLITLIGSVANGLLGSPNMHIVSPVQRGALAWFLDRSDGITPSAGAISVSLWFYKAAMLAWALWLSFALLRWLRWAWTAFSVEGIWRGRVATTKAG